MTMQVEVEAIAKLGEDLVAVATEFDTANAKSEVIAQAVGHPELAQTVRDFAQGWDDKREKIAKATRSLGDAATAVAKTWKDFDQQGADTLNGTDQQAPVPSRSGGPR